MALYERVAGNRRNLFEERPFTLVMSPNDDILQKRFEKLTEGMSNTARRKISALSDENKVILTDFLHELTFKENLPPSTRNLYVISLCCLVEDTKGKFLKDMAAEDVELYLQSHYKPVSQDPKQKRVSTHNVRCIICIRFFKWLYYPQISRKERPKPQVVANIRVMKKPEATNVEAKDLWLPEMDRIFLK